MDEQQDQPQEARREPETPADGTAVATGGRALLVYATRHGSTREIADAVADELRAAFGQVDVREAAAAPPPAGYDAVVVGGPMIMGWHATPGSTSRGTGPARERPVRAVRHRRLADRGRHGRRQGRARRQGPLAGQEATQRRQAHAQGALRPAVPLPRGHLQGLRAGAAALGRRLRRLARPHDHEHLREAVRAADRRRDAGRRPPLGLRARVGGRGGAGRSRPARRGAGRARARGPRGRRAAARGPRPPTRPAPTRPADTSRSRRRCSRRAAARRRCRR